MEIFRHWALTVPEFQIRRWRQPRAAKRILFSQPKETSAKVPPEKPLRLLVYGRATGNVAFLPNG
jgi:hypothetical protein